METKEDLGIKIGTKEENFWTTVMEKAEKDIEGAKHEIEITAVILQHARQKVQEEKAKLK